MSNEMQEYMLSHYQAIKTAQEALEGYFQWLEVETWSSIWEALYFETYWEKKRG